MWKCGYSSQQGIAWNSSHLMTTTILGREECKVLSMFHVLTGCDTVSTSAGRGKRTHGMYGSSSQISQMRYLKSATKRQICRTPVWAPLQDSSLWCMIAQVPCKGRSLESIPPTHHLLVQHVIRAMCQEFLCWGQVLQAQPKNPNPCGLVKGIWRAVHADLDNTTRSCKDLQWTYAVRMNKTMH